MAMPTARERAFTSMDMLAIYAATTHAINVLKPMYRTCGSIPQWNEPTQAAAAKTAINATDQADKQNVGKGVGLEAMQKREWSLRAIVY